MLISCKACAAVNFIQSTRGKGPELHCTICRKLLDLSVPEQARDPKQGFRISNSPGYAELEKKIEELNSNQRLSLTGSFRAEDPDDFVEIEDEEEELLDLAPKVKLPAVDLAQWMTPRVSNVPAAKRRERLNQRLTIAAWVFAVGLGTAGVAGAAVSQIGRASCRERV